jgi:hypothetical protein
MSNRTASSHPHHTAAWSAVAVVLFAIALVFGLLVTLRHAHGWAEVASEGAAIAIPMAADGLVVIVSALTTAVGAIWLYATQLVR